MLGRPLDAADQGVDTDDRWVFDPQILSDDGARRRQIPIVVHEDRWKNDGRQTNRVSERT